MRIPTTKIYRAFPELDRFDDDQCMLLMQRVDLELAAKSLIRFTTAAAIAAGVALVGITWSVTGLEWATGLGRDGDLTIGMIAIVMIPAVIGLLVRDALLRRFLVRAIELRIDRVRCHACKYVLIGQRPVAGAVTCPECGTRNLLVELGVSEDDLIPPTSDFEALSSERVGASR